MEFSIATENGIQVVKLSGNLISEIEAGSLKENFETQIQGGNTRFVVDLSDLRFINSSGLGVLLTCLTKARKVGGDVILTSIPEQLENLLIITKLNSIFTSASSLDEAREQLA